MKLPLFFFFFLIYATSFSQIEGMVKITGEIQHQINTPDSISEIAVKRFIANMEESNFNYEPILRKISNIQIINKDREFVSSFEDGTIYLNSRLNSFPYTKQVAIWQEIYLLTGGKIDNEKRPSVLSNFKVSPDTEIIFYKQNRSNYTLRTLTSKIEK